MKGIFIMVLGNTLGKCWANIWPQNRCI